MAVFYVDLGTNTDVLVGSGSGTGTMGDPFNARAWFLRVITTGTGSITDEYLLKGSAKNINVNVTLYLKMSAWDLTINGKWGMQWLMTGNETFGRSSGADSLTTLQDVLIDANDSAFRLFFTNILNNVLFLSSTTRVAPTAGGAWKGVTIGFTLRIDIGGGGRVMNWENLILRKAINPTGLNVVTLNFTNCVVPPADAMPANWDGFNVVNDLGSDRQFSYVPTDALPTFLETDKDLFLPDSAITIDGSGVYTDHLCGLFGNPRATAQSPGAGIGGSYFPPAAMGGIKGGSNQSLGHKLSLGF